MVSSVCTHPKPNRLIHDEQNDKSAHNRQCPCDRHANRLIQNLVPVPLQQPGRLARPEAGLIPLLAKNPVSSAPSVPPAPCTPNASSESSYPNHVFTLTTIKKQTTPAISPIHSADIGVTNPDAGVIATSPATAPEIAPRIDGLPLRIHSAALQPIAAAAAPKCVATNAEVASDPAASADPH